MPLTISQIQAVVCPAGVQFEYVLRGVFRGKIVHDKFSAMEQELVEFPLTEVESAIAKLCEEREERTARNWSSVFDPLLKPKAPQSETQS